MSFEATYSIWTFNSLIPSSQIHPILFPPPDSFPATLKPRSKVEITVYHNNYVTLSLISSSLFSSPLQLNQNVTLKKCLENGIETCKISCMKRVASPGSMHDTGCLGLVHWDDPEGWYEEGGGFRMGNTCIPVADSFWYLAKLIQYV